MEEKEISHKNELIALFLGVDVNYSEEVYKDSMSPLRHLIHNRPKTEGLEFHSSLDWLIYVIEKIESLGFVVTMSKSQCQVFDRTKSFPENFIIDADFHDDWLKNAYDGVTGFIEWYNDGK
jgi:hypothetical protein